MGIFADMANRISQGITAKSKSSEVERNAAQLAAVRIEKSDKDIEIGRLEAALQQAVLDALDGGGDEVVDDARDALEQSRREADDLARVIAGLEERHRRAVANRDAAVRAKQLESTREAADGMTDGLKKLTVGLGMVVSGAREFYQYRSRFFEVCPQDLRPPAQSPLWTSLETYVKRYVGARCQLFRGDALRGTESIDRLAQVDEIAQLHADALAQVFPESPEPKAA